MATRDPDTDRAFGLMGLDPAAATQVAYDQVKQTLANLRKAGGNPDTLRFESRPARFVMRDQADEVDMSIGVPSA